MKSWYSKTYEEWIYIIDTLTRNAIQMSIIWHLSFYHFLYTHIIQGDRKEKTSDICDFLVNSYCYLTPFVLRIVSYKLSRTMQGDSQHTVLNEEKRRNGIKSGEKLAKIAGDVWQSFGTYKAAWTTFKQMAPLHACRGLAAVQSSLTAIFDKNQI